MGGRGGEGDYETSKELTQRHQGHGRGRGLTNQRVNEPKVVVRHALLVHFDVSKMRVARTKPKLFHFPTIFELLFAAGAIIFPSMKQPLTCSSKSISNSVN